jgi:Fur family transcriptional regulator, ferric uptake regulator
VGPRPPAPDQLRVSPGSSIPGRPNAGLHEAVRTLREHGGRLTPAQEAILRLLHESHGPLSADDVHAQFPEFDPATVYRTLSQFEGAGIINHRHLAHGPATYQWAGSESMPIVCEGCGLTVELGAHEFRALAERVKQQHAMTLLPGHFALTGWCERCAPDGN